MTMGDTYVIRKPYKATDLEFRGKLEKEDDQEVQVKKVLELMEEDKREEGKHVVLRVVHTV